jgi:putative transcriptional regulator
MTTRPPPNHHPSEEMLFDHARVALEPGRALVVAAHLSACPLCRANIRFTEAIGGALLGELEPSEMTEHALDLALARIERPAPPQPPQAPQPEDWIRIPADVRAAANSGRRWVAPGVWVANVTGDARQGGPRSYLLRVAAGMAMPRHTHKGSEFSCILKGAFEDRGVIYGPGDFTECDDDVTHRPHITADGECVCLAATDNSLVPRSVIGRIFQPFVGI